ncbi:MAG TPA: response regulator [Polyangiaceae bacterium]|nr:response regulator [Polyangiaceae bacterium]
MNTRLVLVVDDNPISRKLFRLTLGNAGLSVVEAADAAEALALASKMSPDLILQDLLLPDMDGFELVALLRAEPACAGTPVIAVSGFLSRLQYGRAAAMGFADFLAKPVEPLRLLEVVRAHLPVDPSVRDKEGQGRHVLVVDDDPYSVFDSARSASPSGLRATAGRRSRRCAESRLLPWSVMC